MCSLSITCSVYYLLRMAPHMLHFIADDMANTPQLKHDETKYIGKIFIGARLEAFLMPGSPYGSLCQRQESALPPQPLD